jgi:hypothetical protein
MPVFFLYSAIVPTNNRGWPTSKAESLVLITTIFVLWALILTSRARARQLHHNSELKASHSLSWDCLDVVSSVVAEPASLGIRQNLDSVLFSVNLNCMKKKGRKKTLHKQVAPFSDTK